MSELQDAMMNYYSSGLSPATQRCYRAGLKQYTAFCLQANLPTIPASEHTLLLFATHLAVQKLAYPTIKVYMAAVRNVHVNTGNHVIFAKQLTPRLDLLMRGIRKEKCKTTLQKARLPITMEIMERIKAVLSRTPKDYQCIMLWAVCCTAFFGLLRVSEFTVPSPHQYDADIHLSLADITLDNRQAPEIVRLHIKQSKTDTFRNGADVYLGRTYHNVCPVEAILPYLVIRGKQPGPLFVLADKTMLTRAIFASALKSILSELDLNAHLYNTHSFRIGAATAANNAGVSELHIKALGRWKSDAYQRYIRTPPEQLASLSQQIVQVTNNDR